MKKLMLASALTVFSTMALADNVVVTTTNAWKSVPITVDEGKYTYSTVETVLPEGDYYYTYSGYRCLRDKTVIVGVEPVIYHSSVVGGTDIYCYPE